MARSAAHAALLRYGSALVFLLAALFLRGVLDPWLGDRQQLSLLFGAIALAVWYGGAGPAVLATAVGYFASDYLFIEPRGVFAVAEPHQFISLVIYLVSCGVIIGFGEGLRSGKRRAKRYAQQLEAKQRELEDQERRKDEFLATLAHELRNPLAPLKNATQLIRAAGPGNAEASNALDIIQRQIGYMARLVDDLLDLSRIKSGRLHLHFEHVDLAEVLNAAIDTARPQLEARRHELITCIPDETIHVRADPTRLTQVFLNILSNAAKYTPPGGHVWVTVDASPGATSVSVRDDGVGIRSDMLSRVFDMYEQIERPPQDTQGGLGIGLALVHRILFLHGGHIDVRSEGESRGSEFIVRLARMQADQTAPPHEMSAGGAAAATT
jgi:signal transduction histidine kinase